MPKMRTGLPGVRGRFQSIGLNSSTHVRKLRTRIELLTRVAILRPRERGRFRAAAWKEAAVRAAESGLTDPGRPGRQECKVQLSCRSTSARYPRRCRPD